MLPRAGIVLLIGILSAPAAWGADKTDVVTLRNGDRITGDVDELARGRLSLKTDDAGTIQIEWNKILRIEAQQRLFDVSTSDGRRFLGSLGVTGDGMVLVVSSTGSDSLPMSEVTSITPIGKSFWKKLDGAVDAGFSYTKSSGVATTTLNSDIAFRRPEFKAQLTASATVTSQSDESKYDSRSSVQFSYVRYRGNQWFFAGTGGVESNESLGLVLRSQLTGALGKRIVDTNRAQLSFYGGLAVNNEQGVDTGSTDNLEGLLGFDTSYYTYDSPKTNLDVSLKYYPSLSNWGRQRVQFDLGLKRELFKDFFVGLNGYDTFDSHPPNPNAAHNDVGVTASVGWSFGR
jgi:hypothetical protein